jgi:hypothetical protein
MTSPVRMSVLLPALWDLQLSPWTYARSLASPAAAAAVMTVSVGLLRQTWAFADSRLELLALSILLGGVTYTGTLVLLDRGLVGEARSMVKDLISPSQA